MGRVISGQTLAWFLVLTLFSYSGKAAEIRLRSSCVCAGPVVRLGDVAELVGYEATEAAQLAAIELFPSPHRSGRRTVGLAQVKRILHLHGVDVARSRFSGARRVLVRANAAASTGSTSPTALGLDGHVRNAVLHFLRTRVDHQSAWDVSVALDTTNLRLPRRVREIRVAGGAEPWVGNQPFDIQLVAADGLSWPLYAQVQVTRPETMLVAAADLRRGDVVRAHDLVREPVPEGTRPGTLRASDIVGLEAVRNISAGKQLDKKDFRKTILVNRRKVVTVRARGGGVEVRTQVMALDDGGKGDLVRVESIPNGKQFVTRVTGLGEVEVYSGGASVSTSHLQ